MGIDFDRLKERAGELAQAGVAKAKELTDAGVAKAKQLTEIGKLKMRNSSHRDAIRKAYLELGKLYYDTHKDDPDGFFTQLCQEVTLSLSRVTALEDEIARLKAAEEDVDVEFENVVSAAEDEAECSCGCSCGCQEDEEETPEE